MAVTRGTDREGNPIYFRNGQRFEGTPRTNIVVGVTRTPSGAIATQKNIGRNLSQAQRREIADLSRREGVLRSEVRGDTVTVTAQRTSRAQTTPSAVSRVVQDRFSRFDPIARMSTPTQTTTSVGQAVQDRFSRFASVDDRLLMSEPRDFTRAPRGSVSLSQQAVASGRRSFSEAREQFRSSGQRLRSGDVIGSAREGLAGSVSLLRATASGVASAPLAVGELAGRAIYNPRGLAVSTFVAGRELVTSPSARRSLVSNVRSDVLANPVGAVGGVFTGVGLGRGAREVARVSRNVAVRVGTRQRPATQVFDPDALAGRTRFPMASSTDEIERLFRQRNLEFVTASPAPIAGRESILAGRGLAGTEGAGISVTPMGRGSPAFLQTQSNYGGVVFSLNPFRSVRPTATVGRAEGIIRTPSRVTRQPGFEAENIFMRDEVAGTGTLVIPKRIQIGQGDISPQTFRPLVRDTPSDTGTLGRTRLERGTGELEAKVPLGQQFERVPGSGFFGRLQGFDEFTMVDGFAVPLRRIRLTTGAGSGTTGTVISPRDYANIVSGYSSSLRPGTRVVSPLSASGFAPRGSSTPVSTPPRPTTSSFSPSGFSTPRSSVASPLSSTSVSRTFSPISPSPSTTPRSSRPSRSSPSRTTSLLTPSSPVSTPLRGSTPFSPTGSTTVRTPSSPRSPGGSSSITSSLLTPTPGTPTFTPPRQPRRRTPSFGESQLSRDFTVLVRRRGVFRPVGEFADLQKAFGAGETIVGDTAAASFKVVDRSGRPLIPKGFGDDFRLSDKEAGVLIERRERRIQSAGELREITFQGIAEQRRRRRL